MKPATALILASISIISFALPAIAKPHRTSTCSDHLAQVCFRPPPDSPYPPGTDTGEDIEPAPDTPGAPGSTADGGTQ
jgi:hypothetical protein